MDVKELSPASAYERYVGSITPSEFVRGFEQVNGNPINRVEPTMTAVIAAVSDLIANAWWEGETPEGLDDLLIAYCKDNLGID